MDKIETKRTVIGKFFSFVSNSLGKENGKSTDYILKSRFGAYLSGLDKNSETYSYIKTVTELCDDAMKLYKRKQALNDNISDVLKRMEEIECFNNLSLEEAEKLQELLDRFVNVSKEKSTLYYQLGGFEQGLGYLDKIEGDARFALGQIQEAEKKQRILRHDIGVIEGEKADLEYQKELIGKAFKFTKNFGLLLVSVFIAGALLLGYGYVALNLDIRFSAAALAIAIGFLSVVLYIFRRRVKYEVQINLKKQKRAIELLNKKNTVLAYYTNFLRFEYKKYRVSSSQTLEHNLSSLEHYRHLSKRYDVIRKIMYKSEQEIEMFLKHKEIKTSGTSIESFSKAVNLGNKRNYYAELEEKKSKLEEEFNSANQQHDELWDLILVLNENDHTEDKLVDKIIQDYYSEAARA
ncbi:MAG: hypothetical protein LBV08_00475 [Clostridiales bacterium]|jgi:hypothetical protein|nr:hypothetical protein [Clostridiales bacterium]